MRSEHKGKLAVGLPVFFSVALLVCVAGLPAAAVAQPASAVVSSVTGRVEVLPKGQTPWQPVRLGGSISEGDDVRAFAGANAELRLPDGSRVFVAENSRFVVTKLDFDAQNQMRGAFFHLAVGKLRALVAPGAASRIQARQNNFVITTRPGYAAVKGTVLYGAYDPSLVRATFLVTQGEVIVYGFCSNETVDMEATELSVVTLATPCEPPTPPAAPTPEQLAQITGPAQPPSPDADAVLGAGSVEVVPPDVAAGHIPPPPPSLPPFAVTPPLPPPHDREATPFRFR